MNTTLPGMPDKNPELSQWFTPPKLAEKIVAWGIGDTDLHKRTLQVLEPSCGRGALLRPLAGFHAVHITGVDIDEGNIDHCRNQVEWDVASWAFFCGDFLKVTKFPRRFDVAIMNPPFESGQTENHILHALQFCKRVVCHCPMTTLAGKARREGLWSQARLQRLAICSTRPKYGARSGATDMCTIEVVKHDRNPGAPMACSVEWWP